jgi:group I intron endonuclease
MQRYYIYKHTCIPTGRVYVGYTRKSVWSRWLSHVRDARKGSGFAFHRAIRKYGPDAFAHETLEVMHTFAGAQRAERIWIHRLNTMVPNGYNLTVGGDGTTGLRWSEESRRKRSESMRGRQFSREHIEMLRQLNTGRRATAEARRKMSEARKGKPLGPFTDEHKRHMSESRLGKYSEAQRVAAATRRGKPMSEETRGKMSASHKGVPITDAQRAAYELTSVRFRVRHRLGIDLAKKLEADGELRANIAELAGIFSSLDPDQRSEALVVMLDLGREK